MGKIERSILNDSGYEVWMRRREKEFCDEIEPVQVQKIEGENVVWARRMGISDTGFFDFHHIGCDHLGAVQRGESEIKAMLGCSAVQTFLFDSAGRTAELFQLPTILPEFTYEEGQELHLDEEGEHLGVRFLFEALVRTIEDPGHCQGNIRTGLHVKPVVQYMMGGISETQLDVLGGKLTEEGFATYEDPFFALAA